MNSRLKWSVVALAMLLFASREAEANFITIEYTATISNVDRDALGLLPTIGVVAGAVGAGTLTWNPDAIPRFPGPPPSWGDPGVVQMTFDLEEYSVIASFASFSVMTATPTNWWVDFEDPRFSPTDRGTIGYILFNLFAAPGTSLRTDIPILQAFDPAVLDHGTIRFGSDDSPLTATAFTATISSVHVVPEPATWMLIVMTIVVTAAFNRRAVIR